MIICPCLFQICHSTGNKKCPWKDLQVADSAVTGHLTHGDKIGPCDETCMECEEFDPATCQCVFASCPPSESPSLSPIQSISYKPTGGKKKVRHANKRAWVVWCGGFDTATCEWVFALCPPSQSPSYYPNTVSSPIPSASFRPTGGETKVRHGRR